MIKAGDILICVDNNLLGLSLTKGRSYLAVSDECNGSVSVVTERSGRGKFRSSCFVVDKSIKREELLNSILTKC
jgi:hypothetical protein